MSSRHPRQRAFTLVELSIVLVILGLLVGGVLTGQSLINAAQLRAVSTEYTKFSTATYAFKDKYIALPGDITNATQFWGIAGGTGNDSACGLVASTDKKTCDGDGDGQVTTKFANRREEFRFWQHLSNAGLIEGVYNGTSPPVISASVPSSKKNSNGYWYLNYWGTSAATTQYFGGTFGHTFGMFPISGLGSLTPQEAWNIDTKMDDGKPGTGNVISFKGSVTAPCTSNFNNISDSNATYSLSNESMICYLQFISTF